MTQTMWVLSFLIPLKTTKQKHAFIGRVMWILVTEPRDTLSWKIFMWELQLYEFNLDLGRIMYTLSSISSGMKEINNQIKNTEV